MGRGYCSSTDWPNVSRFDGNGNGDGMVMVMLMVSFLLYISSTSPEHFPICVLGTPSTKTVQKVEKGKKSAPKKEEKNWGWQLSSWQMFGFWGWEMSEFGGGKCPNFGGSKCPPGK